MFGFGLDSIGVIDVVAGVIFNEARDQVLLALRKPKQHQGDHWKFPGGELEVGEAQQQGLARELFEEIAIVVTQSEHHLTLRHEYPDKLVRLHFWDVTSFNGEPYGREGQELRWVALGDLPSLSFPEANRVVVDQYFLLARSQSYETCLMYGRIGQIIV